MKVGRGVCRSLGMAIVAGSRIEASNGVGSSRLHHVYSGRSLGCLRFAWLVMFVMEFSYDLLHVVDLDFSPGHYRLYYLPLWWSVVTCLMWGFFLLRFLGRLGRSGLVQFRRRFCRRGISSPSGQARNLS